MKIENGLIKENQPSQKFAFDIYLARLIIINDNSSTVYEQGAWE